MDNEAIPISHWPTLTTVWLIQRVKNGERRFGFFNIKVGTWHSSPLVATRFPTKEAAESYIEEFGIEDVSDAFDFAYDR